MSIKVIKPLRLSLLYRPYRWHAENHLCIAAMALVDLSTDQPKVLSDIELWRDCVPQMDCEGVLDLVLPKTVPEYLIAASAYTAHQNDKTKVAVKARVAELEKTLIVFGERRWLDERTISEPEAFEQKAISWSTTFGGPKYSLNPLGKGMEAHKQENGLVYEPLPNVEGLEQRVIRRGQGGEAVSFGPLNVLWPQRYQHVGTYTEEWKKHEFPGFFPDLNPLMFNAAAPDQHWATRDQVPLGESFAFWNMHPRLPCWEGRLPNWNVRCFAEVQDSGQSHVKEVAMRATTVWFLPDQERAVLIYHGSLAVSEHDASDVRKLMPALEEATMPPLALSHYQEIMRKRADPKQGGLYVDADDQLVPLALHGPLSLDMPDVFRHAVWVKMRNRLQQLQAEMAAELAKEGHNPDEYFLEMVGPPRRHDEMDLTDSAWQPKSIEEEQQAMLMQMDEDHLAEVEQSSLSTEEKQRWMDQRPSRFLNEALQSEQTGEKGPPVSILAQLQSAQALQQGLKKGQVDVEALDRINPDWAFDATHRERVAQSQLPEGEIEPELGDTFALMDDPAFLLQMERLDALQRQMYLLSVQTQSPVERLSDEQSDGLRQQLLARHANQESLQELDLTGAILSGLPMAHADFSGAWLEGADLRDAVFEHCVFDSAVLARTQLQGARFVECVFEGANLSFAALQNTTFRQCRFKQTVFEDVQLRQTVFADCDFSEMSLAKLELDACVWEGGQFNLSMFDELNITDCTFTSTRFDKVSFQNTQIQGSRFVETWFQGCGFFISEFEQVLFDEAVLKNCAIHYQSRTTDVVFNKADLSQCFFREMDLGSVDFGGSRIQMCDFSLCSMVGTVMTQVDAEKANFSGAILHQADFRQAHLIDADFTGADLRFTNLKQANLFRANLALAHLDDSTVLHEAYVNEANAYPLRNPRDVVNG